MFLLVFFIFSNMEKLECLEIPRVTNTLIIPLSPTNTRTFLNGTIEHCLCSNWKNNSMAINYLFINDSCEIFGEYPRIYRILSTNFSHLYFPQRISLNLSECCMSDWADLNSKLIQANSSETSVSKIRNIAIDNKGFIITIDYQDDKLRWFSQDFASTTTSSISSSGTFLYATYSYGAYFIVRSDNTILMLNSTNWLVINTISSPYIACISNIVFLENGKRMIMTSTSNDRLIIFVRSNSSSFSCLQSFIYNVVFITFWLIIYKRFVFLCEQIIKQCDLFSFVQQLEPIDREVIDSFYEFEIHHYGKIHKFRSMWSYMTFNKRYGLICLRSTRSIPRRLQCIEIWLFHFRYR